MKVFSLYMLINVSLAAEDQKRAMKAASVILDNDSGDVLSAASRSA